MELKQKKSIFEMEIFPIFIDGTTYYVTYTVLKEWVQSSVANALEKSIYDEVKFIFEPSLYGTK